MKIGLSLELQECSSHMSHVIMDLVYNFSNCDSFLGTHYVVSLKHDCILRNSLTFYLLKWSFYMFAVKRNAGKSINEKLFFSASLDVFNFFSCILLQSVLSDQMSGWRLVFCELVLYSLVDIYSSTLKMDTAHSYETLVNIYQTSWHHFPRDGVVCHEVEHLYQQMSRGTVTTMKISNLVNVWLVTFIKSGLAYWNCDWREYCQIMTSVLDIVLEGFLPDYKVVNFQQWQ